MLFVRALLLVMIGYEFLADMLGWRGVSWGRPAARPLLAIAALALHPRGTSWRQRLPALALAILPALLAHVAIASLRRRGLNPLALLEPGDYADRITERVDIPMAEGHMPALYITPRGGARAAAAVLHGSGCDKTYFAWRMVNTLIERNLAVLLVDLDGHGDNPRPQRFPQSVDCAHEATRWLRQRHERVGMIGISLGGCLAARAAADGMAVDALALLETPPQLRFDNRDRWREARELIQPYMLSLLGEASAPWLAYAVYDLVRAQRAPRIQAAISTWELIDACDLTGSLAKLETPLLLVYGERDAIVKPAQAEEVWQAAPPGTTMLMAPDASHLTLTLHPDALGRTAAWLAEQLRRKTP